MKKLLSIILALVLVMGLSVPALAAESDFTIENGVLTKYNGEGGDVVIPEGVTEIGWGAFLDCDSLTGVTIPSSVTTIGGCAFQFCTSLTSVTIPEGVTSIGQSAFSGCDSLTSVTIPSSVTNIGYSAFYDTPWLEAQLEAQGEFPVVNGILIAYQGDGGDVVIPKGVTSIGEGVFWYRTSLTSVTIPEGVTTIGGVAFSDCYNLTSVTIPSSVTTIGACAFQFCESLTSVTIPSSVTTIGSSAFDCTGLTSVTIPTSVTAIDGYAFRYTPWLEAQGEFAVVNGILLAYQGDGGDVVIPEGITSIGDGAFEGCDSLTSVTIPASVTTIGYAAFGRCSGLTSVTIPEGVTTISGGMFNNCRRLTSVTIPSSVTTIDEGAFYNCNSLTDVYYAGSQAQWEAISIDYSGHGNEELTNATIHYGGAAPMLAYARTQTIAIDGKAVELQAYALKDENGYETNYVKLRDVAYALNGTSAQFNVGWDGNVNIVTGAAYNPNGSEMSTPFSGDRAYTVPTTGTNVNGVAADLAAIVLTDDNGGGHTYYQLRDLGKALGFNVDWTAERGIFIETETKDNNTSGATSETNQGPILVKSDDEYGLSYWVEYGPLGPVYTPACESDLCSYSNYNCYGEDDPDHVEYADERMVIDAYLHGAIQECTVEAWEEYVARRDGNTQN